MPRQRNQHCVIYVPGLGDRRVAGQRLAVRQWRFQGVKPYLFRMDWASEEPFDVKLNRLLRLIDRLAGEGKTVSLIGASAGASVVLAAFAERPDIINGVVCLSGKILRPETVSGYTYRYNPPFRTSMERLPAALDKLGDTDRKRVLSLKALADESVPPADSYLQGAGHGTLPVAGHMLGIAYGLTLGSRRAIKFLKRTARDIQ